MAVHGSMRVEERGKGRVWVATIAGGKSGRTRKTLGPAWVRDSGRRTPRGAVIWRAGAGSRPDETYLTPELAQARLDELLAEEAKEERPTRRGATWGQAVELYLDDIEHVKAVSSGTLRGYRSYLRCLSQEGLYPESTPLRRIDAAFVERAERAQLVSGLGRKTVHNRQLVIRAVLSFASSKGLCRPLGETNLIKAPAKHEDFNVLEPHEVEAIARAMTIIPPGEVPRVRGAKGAKVEDRPVHEHTLELMKRRRKVWAAAVRFSAFTGLRVGELRALNWSDVDIAGRRVRVVANAPSAEAAPKAGERRRRTKGGRGRSVPLIDRAVVVLDELSRLVDTAPDAPVFPTSTGGRLEISDVREAFYAALAHKSVGLGRLREKASPIVLHDLRHTFGTIAVRVAPLSDVQAWMGHRDVSTTMIYVHHVPRVDDAARLNRAFEADTAAAVLEPVAS